MAHDFCRNRRNHKIGTNRITTANAPTEFTDGSPLDPVNDLSKVTLKCSGAAEVVQDIPPAVEIDWVAAVGQFPHGQYTCVMTATDISGMESADSNSVSFEVDQKRPNAPVILLVN